MLSLAVRSDPHVLYRAGLLALLSTKPALAEAVFSAFAGQPRRVASPEPSCAPFPQETPTPRTLGRISAPSPAPPGGPPIVLQRWSIIKPVRPGPAALIIRGPSPPWSG